MAPVQPETDPADPLSPLESAALWDPADPQPGPSSIEPPAHCDSDLTRPNPVPGESGLKMTSDTDPADPEPADSRSSYYSGSFNSDLFFHNCNRKSVYLPDPLHSPFSLSHEIMLYLLQYLTCV